MSTAEGGGNIIRNGLILYLDAANKKSIISGDTTWSDLTINEYDGTLENSPTYDSDNKGNIIFDGSSDYIDLSTHANELIFDSPATIDFWFKPSLDKSLVGGVIFSIGNGLGITASDSLSIFYGNVTSALTDETVTIINGSNGLDNASKLTTFGADTNTSIEYQNKWTHTSLVIESGTWTLYINGEEKTLVRATNSSANNFWYGENINPKSYVYIGARDLGSPTTNFNGAIANFKIYNRGLSSSEVNQNYNTMKPRFNI